MTHDRGAKGTRSATSVSAPVSHLLEVFAVLAALCSAIGLAISIFSDFLVHVPVIPFELVIELLDSFSGATRILVALLGGAGVGLVLAVLVLFHELRVTVSDTEVILKGEDKPRRRYARAEIGAVFQQGDRLTVLAPDGIELTSAESPLDARELAAAFTGHGYPWSEEDPYRDAWRLWESPAPELTPQTNDLLQERQRVVGRRLEKDRAKELLRSLNTLGICIRDEGRRQYWHPARRP